MVEEKSCLQPKPTGLKLVAQNWRRFREVSNETTKLHSTMVDLYQSVEPFGDDAGIQKELREFSKAIDAVRNLDAVIFARWKQMEDYVDESEKEMLKLLER